MTGMTVWLGVHVECPACFPLGSRFRVEYRDARCSKQHRSIMSEMWRDSGDLLKIMSVSSEDYVVAN